MLYKWLLAFKKPSNQLWVTPAYWTVITTIFVFSLRLGEEALPHDMLPNITQDVLGSLLNVVASSMLAVITFSLSIMVGAFSAAANSATPRALDLVMDDKSTRTAISSFICAFIYAVIAKTVLGLDFYAQNGRFILFVSTIIVLIYLIVTLIRWIYTLSLLGRLGNTLDKISQAAATSLAQYRQSPTLHTTLSFMPTTAMLEIKAACCGYLTHIDFHTLQKLAEENQLQIHINRRPGELITPDATLCFVDGMIEDHKLIQHCFVFSSARTFEQDPTWGFIVLGEAAQRALSPAVNDPGTAINVMSRMMSLLLAEAKELPNDVKFDRLSICDFDCRELIQEAFTPIARDGAGIIEVNLVMQKVLASIWRNVKEPELAEAAKTMAVQAMARAKQGLSFEADIELLAEKHRQLFREQP